MEKKEKKSPRTSEDVFWAHLQLQQPILGWMLMVLIPVCHFTDIATPSVQGKSNEHVERSPLSSGRRQARSLSDVTHHPFGRMAVVRP